MNILLHLAVILLAAQTPVPVPRQASQTHAQENTDVEHQSQRKQQKSEPSSVAMKAVKPDEEHSPTNGGQSHQQPRNVIIEKLPPVALEYQRLMGRDWVLLFFNGSLVIVGTAQAFYVALTLSHIKRQANVMERQTNLSINERRARITFTPLDLRLEKTYWSIPCKVRHYGPTAAWGVDGTYDTKICPRGSMPSVERRIPMGVPTIIERDPVEIRDMWLFDSVESTPSNFDKLVSSELELHLKGCITYTDVFGEKRMTSFRYVYKRLDHTSYAGKPSFYWSKTGTEDENKET